MQAAIRLGMAAPATMVANGMLKVTCDAEKGGALSLGGPIRLRRPVVETEAAAACVGS